MKNNGGSAFPEIISDKDKSGQYDTYSYGGMSLRDYFAGQALIGLILRGLHVQEMPGNRIEYAKISYSFADAMLEVRENEK